MAAHTQIQIGYDLLRRPDIIRTIPTVPISRYRDGFGNWCTRIVAPAGTIRLTTDALIDDDGLPSGVTNARRAPLSQRNPDRQR